MKSHKVWWGDHGQELNAYPACSLPSLLGQGGNRGKRKSLWTDIITVKQENEKMQCKIEGKKKIHSLCSIGRQWYSHCLESRTSTLVLVSWELKHQSRECPAFLLFLLSFYCWTWCCMVWNITVVIWGQLSQLCPQILPSPLTEERGKGRESLNAVYFQQ